MEKGKLKCIRSSGGVSYDGNVRAVGNNIFFFLIVFELMSFIFHTDVQLHEHEIHLLAPGTSVSG